MYCTENGNLSKQDGGNKMHLNISGIHFDVSVKTMEAVQGSKLKKIAGDFLDNGNSDYFFERPVGPFEAVLAFHQTGKLHIPQGICPGAFKDELAFWGISSNAMENCCYRRFASFLNEQKVLEGFLQDLNRDKNIREESNLKEPRLASRIRSKAWFILDNRNDSVVTKIYFSVATAFIVLAIFATAFSTLPSIRKKDSNGNVNETTEFSPTTVKVPTNTIRDLSQFCAGPCKNDQKENEKVDETLESQPSKLGQPTEASNKDITTSQSFVPKRLLKKQFKNKIKVNQTGNNSSELDVHNVTVETDRQNISGITNIKNFLRPLDAFRQVKKFVENILPTDPKEKILTLHTANDKHQVVFVYLEYVTNVFFTGELMLRIICCPFELHYIFSFQNVVDMLALGGVYMRTLLYLLVSEDHYNLIDKLLYLQMLRVLRLLRLLQKVTAFQVLCYSAKIGKKDLLVMLLYIMIGVLFFSNFIYFVEETKDFPSIPDAWWWSMVTMTTVGYGDTVPKTAAGKVIGSMCAFSGVLMFSLIIPIFVNNFITLYQYTEIKSRPFHKNTKTSQEELSIKKEKDVKILSTHL